MAYSSIRDESASKLSSLFRAYNDTLRASALLQQTLCGLRHAIKHHERYPTVESGPYEWAERRAAANKFRDELDTKPPLSVGPYPYDKYPMRSGQAWDIGYHVVSNDDTNNYGPNGEITLDALIQQLLQVRAVAGKDLPIKWGFCRTGEEETEWLQGVDHFDYAPDVAGNECCRVFTTTHWDRSRRYREPKGDGQGVEEIPTHIPPDQTKAKATTLITLITP